MSSPAAELAGYQGDRRQLADCQSAWDNMVPDVPEDYDPDDTDEPDYEE